MKIVKEVLKYKIWLFCIAFSIFMCIFSPAFRTANNVNSILVSMFSVWDGCSGTDVRTGNRYQ
mgnify:CR=1 FL=1